MVDRWADFGIASWPGGHDDRRQDRTKQVIMVIAGPRVGAFVPRPRSSRRRLGSNRPIGPTFAARDLFDSVGMATGHGPQWPVAIDTTSLLGYGHFTRLRNRAIGQFIARRQHLRIFHPVPHALGLSGHRRGQFLNARKDAAAMASARRATHTWSKPPLCPRYSP